MTDTGGASDEGWSVSRVGTEAVLTVILTVGIVSQAVALATLVFSGPIQDGRAAGVSSFLVGSGLVAAWLALRSRLVPLASVSQDAPAVVLVAVVASLISRQPDIDARTVTGLLAVSTLVAGLTMFAVGRLGLGEPVRYLPTVVVHGFIAGTGCLLIRGGFEVAVGEALSLDRMDWLIEAATVARWLPAVALALTVTAIGRSRLAPAWAPSAATVGSLITFYVVVAVVSSPAEVRDDGWLVGPFDSTGSPVLVGPRTLADLPWSVLGRSLGDLLSLLVVTVVAVLLNLSALETIRRRRVDTGYELRQVGIANAVIAPLGAIPVFHSLGNSSLAQRMGVRSRTVVVAVGTAAVFFGIFGAEIIGFVPVFVAGGLLVSVGLGLLTSFARFLNGPLGLVDRAMSCAVVALIVVVGILEGVVIGLILACGLFIVRYSRVDVIRRMSDGTVLRSRVDRSEADLETLQALGPQTSVVQLQGYVFFASATRLVDRLRGLVEAPVRTLVIDLRFVTGVEPGTVQAMAPLVDELTHRNVDVVVSGPEAVVERMLGGNAAAQFPTLDAALANVEDRVLSATGRAEPPAANDEERAAVVRTAMLSGFDRKLLQPGDALMEAGSPADELVFLLDGTVSVMVGPASGARHRLRRTTAPSWMGEIGFLKESTRTADVIAETEIECAVLGRAEYERLRRTAPDQAEQILRDIALTAAERTASLTQALTQSLE